MIRILRRTIPFLFLWSQLLAQEISDRTTIEADNQRFVIARGGLMLRDTPAQTGQAIMRMPYGSSIQMLKWSHKYVAIAGEYGAWAVVKYSGRVGWAFSAYFRNEVAPDPTVKHWNEQHTAYFVVQAGEGLNECGILFANVTCQISVFDAKGKLVATKREMSSAGWNGEAIILSTYSADGGGGGLVQESWFPDEDKVEPYFSSTFTNNAGYPVPTGALETRALCIKAECFFADLNKSRHMVYIFAGKESERHSARLLREIAYHDAVEFGSVNRKPNIYIDGVTYNLPSLEIQK